MTAVERTATEWRSAGRLTAADQTTIVRAARLAERDLA
jgi:hypothetical protein